MRCCARWRSGPQPNPEGPSRNTACVPRLLNCPFAVELTMPSLRVPLRALVGLSPGALLGLGRSSRHPATLLVAGQEMFTATVARRGPLRAAQVLARRVKRDAVEILGCLQHRELYTMCSCVPGHSRRERLALPRRFEPYNLKIKQELLL